MRDRLHHALAAVLSLGAALGVLWPALGEGRVPGNWRHPDHAGNHWLLEWGASQLLSGGSLLHNDRYYHPVGDAPLLAGNGMELFPYLPFALALDWPASATAFALAQLSLAGLGAYALARAAGAGAGGGWLAAVALAGHPYLVAELDMGHFSQADLGWMALALAAGLRVLQGGGPRWALAAGALGGVCALLYWYHGLFLALAAALLTLARPRPRPWRDLALALGVAALTCGPFLAFSLLHLAEVPGVGEPFPSPRAQEAVVRPGLPFGVEGAWQQARVVAPALLLLAIPGLRGAGGWALVAALGALLAMGGAPYEALHGLHPALERFWWPYRYAALTQLALAVLAARGLTRLSPSPWPGLALALSLPLQLEATGDLRRVKVSPLARPETVYASLARMPEGLLLEPPLWPGAAASQALLVAQLLHGKPLLTGHALWVDRVRPRAWDARVQANPSLAALSAWEAGGPGLIPTEGLQDLRDEGWRYLVVNPGRFARALAAQPRGWERLGEALGRLAAEGRGVRLYVIEEVPAGPLRLPEVRWPPGLAPAGPEEPLQATPWPEPLFEAVQEDPRRR